MIDIIIAVYNTPTNDLERCLNSIKNQSYKNWTAYIIDDGSKKEVADWLDSYGKTDKRFKIIHTENKGVSSARNTGLKLCTGNYITFCDSDDTLTEYCFEEGINIIKKYNVDLVIGATEIIYNDSTKNCATNDDCILEKEEINELYQYMLTNKNKKEETTFGNLMSARIYPKLYKKELLKEIRFDTELIMHEDNLFSYNMIEKCKKVYISKSIWYDYYQNSYSITHVKYSKKLLEQEKIFINKLYNISKELKDEYLINAYKIKMFYSLINYIQMASKFKKEKHKILDEILKEKTIKYISSLELNDYEKMPLKHKLFSRIMKLKNNKILLHIAVSILSYKK